MTPTRPVLRWHGGKWMLARKIIQYFPPHQSYTEVFGGVASVLMQNPRSYAEVYNDLDQDVVNLFRILRDPERSQDLRRRLELTPFSRVEFFDAYKPTQDPMERARALVIRSGMGFSSRSTTSEHKTGFRTYSNKGRMSIPAHDWMTYPACLDAMTERFKGVMIECRPAIQVLKKHDTDLTLHYIDPPYVHSSRGPGQLKNYRHEMTDQDHRELAEVAKSLRGGVVISGYASELYGELYPDWNRVEIKALADGARKRTEVLWVNEKAWREGNRMELMAGMI